MHYSQPVAGVISFTTLDHNCISDAAKMIGSMLAVGWSILKGRAWRYHVIFDVRSKVPIRQCRTSTIPYPIVSHVWNA